MKNKFMVKISDVIRDIKKSQLAKYHRDKSWEHCYLFFRKYKRLRNDDEFLDHAALHLGFFLASWGMLRGSSFLLKKDYKFYIPLVRILISRDYEKLWNCNFLEKSQEKNINSLFGLKEKLRAIIADNNKKDGDYKKHEVNLIITKIIMATMGCIPAYDIYFKKGINKELRKKNPKIKFSNFNENSFNNLLNLIEKNEKLKKVCKKSCYIQGTDIKYPPMKLLDLYFWLLGN